jgi:hypothetical protein
MQVHIDGDLVSECSHILPERWNGFSVPVFSEDQKQFIIGECVRLGWTYVMDDGTPAHLDGWEDLGNGEWVASGWVWEEVEETK